MTDHVVPDIPFDRVKKQLSEVKGALVEAPLVSIVPSLPSSQRAARCRGWSMPLTCTQDFLIDQKDFTDGIEWTADIEVNPTLPIYL